MSSVRSLSRLCVSDSDSLICGRQPNTLTCGNTSQRRDSFCVNAVQGCDLVYLWHD